jgi:2-dehydropantoate 2-reductase
MVTRSRFIQNAVAPGRGRPSWDHAEAPSGLESADGSDSIAGVLGRLGGSKESIMPHVHIVIAGAGAIGGFYGGKLAQAGAGVSVVCRSDYDVVRKNGFEIASPSGDFKFIPEKVLRRASDYGRFPDYVIVATKVLPELDTGRLIRDVVGPETVIVLIQNGVDIEAPVVEAFPDNEIVSGLAFIAVSRVGPGKIRHLDYGRLTLGGFPSGTSERVKVLGDLLLAADVPVEITPDVVRARWQKLVWNAPFNPISVLAGGVDTAQMLGSPEVAKLAREVMEEVCATAKAVGHELPADVVQRNIDGTLVMKPYKTSMLLDFEAGRPMEVEAILGNAVRAARRCKVSVPRLESLYALLQLADCQNRRGKLLTDGE